MLWIKRNLFIVIGLAVSLVLLGGAGYYVYNGFYDNDDQDVALEQLKAELQGFSTGYYPNEENISVIRSNTALAQTFMADAGKLLESQPPRPMNAATFSIELVKAIDRLRRDATNASVELPARFDFTFGEIKTQPRIFPYAVEPLNTQLNEITTLCGILFKAKVRAIESLQRVPAYVGDPPSQDIITDLAPRTNEISTNLNLVMTPYRVTFRGFVGELTAVLNGLARTKDFVVVRQLDLDAGAASPVPAGGVDPMMMTPGGVGLPSMAPGGLTPPTGFGLAPGGPPGVGNPAMAPPPGAGVAPPPRPPQPVARPGAPGTPPPAPKSTLTPVLDEKPLRVTLVIDFIKATRRPATAPSPAK